MVDVKDHFCQQSRESLHVHCTLYSVKVYFTLYSAVQAFLTDGRRNPGFFSTLSKSLDNFRATIFTARSAAGTKLFITEVS